MTDRENQSDQTSAKGRTRWEAMRPRVVPRQLLRPITELEEVIGNLRPLLDADAKKTKNFVERYHAERTPEQTKQAFEEIIAKLEWVCRHARKERWVTRDIYDIPVLQPMLDRLNEPVRQDEYARSMVDAFPRPVFVVRAKRVEAIGQVLANYADEFADKVDVDRLWNAYRIDFSGKRPDQLAAHPFIHDYPRTATLLRGIARANKLQRLLKIMHEGTQEQIIAATGNFLKQLPAGDALRAGDFVKDCELLAQATPFRASDLDVTPMHEADGDDSGDLFSPHENKGKQALSAEQQFSNARRHVIETLTATVDAELEYHGKKAASDAARHAHAQQFKQELLDAYREDAKALNRSNAGRERAAASLVSAPHIEPLISYLRAEAALRTAEKILKQSARAVTSIYADSPQMGKGQGS